MLIVIFEKLNKKRKERKQRSEKFISDLDYVLLSNSLESNYSEHHRENYTPFFNFNLRYKKKFVPNSFTIITLNSLMFIARNNPSLRSFRQLKNKFHLVISW